MNIGRRWREKRRALIENQEFIVIRIDVLRWTLPNDIDQSLEIKTCPCQRSNPCSVMITSKHSFEQFRIRSNTSPEPSKRYSLIRCWISSRSSSRENFRLVPRKKDAGHFAYLCRIEWLYRWRRHLRTIAVDDGYCYYYAESSIDSMTFYSRTEKKRRSLATLNKYVFESLETPHKATEHSLESAKNEMSNAWNQVQSSYWDGDDDAWAFP